MKYKSEYHNIVKKVKKMLPHKIDDEYFSNITKFENGKKGGSYTLEYTWGLCGQNASKFDLSGLSKENFGKLSFDTNTIFSSEQIEKFNPTKILESGKRVGLDIELLHKAGINGTGINVAVIDSNFDINNPEMLNEYGNTKVKLYDNRTMQGKQKQKIDDFHGKAVTSLLCGTTVGIAPQSNLYFFSIDKCRNNQDIQDILQKIILLNQSGCNISVVSMSSSLQNLELKNQYTKELSKYHCAFISSDHFWDSGFDYTNRDNEKDINDPNNFSLENPIDFSEITEESFKSDMNSLKQRFSELENYINILNNKLETSVSEEEREEIRAEIESKKELLEQKDKMLNISYEDYCNERLRRKEKQLKSNLYVPCGGRTYPQIGKGYRYCGHSSASWAIPQVSGLYILSKQLDPFLSFEEFTKVSFETSYKTSNGYCVINPIGIVMKINELNQIKAENNKSYQTISKNSSHLISSLNDVIKKEKSFSEELKENVNQTFKLESITKSLKDKDDYIRN